MQKVPAQPVAASAHKGQLRQQLQHTWPLGSPQQQLDDSWPPINAPEQGEVARSVDEVGVCTSTQQRLGTLQPAPAHNRD